METPKIIWQTWKTKVVKNIPEKLRGYSTKWKETHGEYTHVLLDDDDLRNIVEQTVPKYLGIYDSFTHNIERVDFARYALLYLKGGVYADMDTIPLKKITYFVEMNKIVLGTEPTEHNLLKIHGFDKLVCNAFMISPPGEKFWMNFMDYIIENYQYNYRPVETTGPVAITKFMMRNKNNVLITDPCVFYPVNADGRISKGCDIMKSYVAHMWENTWVLPWWKDPMWHRRILYFVIIALCILIIHYIYNK